MVRLEFTGLGGAQACLDWVSRLDRGKPHPLADELATCLDWPSLKLVEFGYMHLGLAIIDASSGERRRRKEKKKEKMKIQFF